MRSKFVSAVLSAAVCLAMVLVPAAVSSADGNTVKIEIDPALQKVLPGQSFDFDVMVPITASENVSSAEAHIDFDNTRINVTGMVKGDLTKMLKCEFNNTAGTIDYVGMIDVTLIPPDQPMNSTFRLCSVNCTAKLLEGNATINFVYIGPNRKTQVFSPAAVDYLTNWSTQVVHGTVTVGTPKLTLNITPRVWTGVSWLYMGSLGIGYNITWSAGPGSIPLSYDFLVMLHNSTFPNTTSWSWGEWLIVAGADTMPGWTFNTATNFTPPLGPMLPGAHYIDYMGQNITIYPMIIPGMDTLTKTTTAPFVQKAPEIGVLPPSLSFEAFEGINPADDYLVLWNNGGGTLNWSASTDAGWLSVAPTNGSLIMDWYAQQNQTLVVSVNVTGLSADTYSGNVTITGASNVTVPVGLWVKPATAVDSCRAIMGSGDSGNPEETTELYAGETIDVYVNFTAPPTSPNNGFNAIGLTDLAPDGWTVTVNKSWCWVDGSPATALLVNAIGNKAEIMLAGPYDEGKNISLMYKVTVPTTATPGLNTWPKCGEADEADAWLEYYFNEEGPYTNCIGCDYQVVVTQPGDLVGETREVNSAELPDVEVRLYRVAGSPSPLRSDISTPDYVNAAYVTGTYWMTANLTRWYELDITDGVMLPGKSFTIDLTTPAKLAAGNTFDFEGDYGLIPKACTMAYALKSVNLWKIGCSANPEYNLSDWKVMDVCNSWLYPS